MNQPATGQHLVCKRVIVGDDHPLVRLALCDVIAGLFPAMQVVGCPTLGAVMETVGDAPERVALVLLDLDMPGMFGFAGLFLMQARHPAVAVAIVSATENGLTIRRALAFGAAGYIPKSLAVSGIADAIRAILAGSVWAPAQANADPAIAGMSHDPGAADNPDWAHDAGDLEFARRFSTLSGQQIRILTAVFTGRLNKQIAADLAIAEQTVKAHVSVILKKLGVASRTRAAVLAGEFLLGTESSFKASPASNPDAESS